jgi:uncharacterized protein (TIRG00374 family)
MRTHGVTYAESIGTLFVERLLDLVAIVILASLVAYDNPTYRPLLLGIALAALLLVMIVGHPMLPRLLERLSARYHSPRMAKALNAGHNLLLSSRRLLSPAPLLFGISLGLVAWGAEGLGFYFICQSMQLNIDLHTSIGIYSLAALAGSAAIFLPGGIGGMEIVMTALLTAHGAPLSAALIATLLCRLATLWFAVVIGLATTALLEFNSRQSETTAASA